MYTSYSVAETIKKTAIARRVPVKTVLTDLGLGKNTLSNMYNGSMLRSDTLARIADYLDCSVDYLLGRTDTPECSDSPKGNYVSNVNSDNNTIEHQRSAPSWYAFIPRFPFGSKCGCSALRLNWNRNHKKTAWQFNKYVNI